MLETTPLHALKKERFHRIRTLLKAQNALEAIDREIASRSHNENFAPTVPSGFPIPEGYQGMTHDQQQ